MKNARESEETVPFCFKQRRLPSHRSSPSAAYAEVCYVFICHIPDILVIIVKHQKEKKPSLIHYFKEIGDKNSEVTFKRKNTIGSKGFR